MSVLYVSVCWFMKYC